MSRPIFVKSYLKVIYLTILQILIYISLYITCSTTIANAQIFDDGQAHHKIDWHQIRHHRFDLIFPKEFEKNAPHLATQIELFIKHHETQFKKSIGKVKIILQQNHVEQNGYMQLAPRKSELYGLQGSSSTNQQWLPNLTLHEIRHTAQFDNATGKLKSPLFEQLGLALFGLTIPSWYFEGDAVLSETLFSDGGRGRLSSWHMPIRAILSEDISYSFNKYVHGSFKSNLPSYYTIGYMMNSELYNINPNGIEALYDKLSNSPLRIQNFDKSLKSVYGLKSKQLFDRTLSQLKEAWELPHSNDTNLINHLIEKYPTDYLLPQANDNWIYSMEISRQRVPHIIKSDITNPSAKTYVTPVGLQITPYFHVKKYLITWDEIRKHPRFEKETYNIINLYDVNTNKRKKISTQSRLYNPIISTDLTTLLAVGIDSVNRSYLAFYDIEKHIWKTRKYLPEGIHIIQPQFNPTNDKIIGIGISEKGTNLVEVNLKNLSLNTLLEWSNLELERPSYYKDGIIFKANQSHKDNVYYLEEGKFYLLSNSKYGAFNPISHNNILYYSDYQVDGFKTASKFINIKESTPITFDNRATMLFPNQDIFNTNMPVVSSDSSSHYTIEKYNSLKNLFNFHSLSLSGNDFESFDNFRPGIFWLSNNIMNTTKAKLGYEYDLDTRKSMYSAEITLQKWYPQFNISYLNRGQLGAATNSQTNENFNFDWREHVISATVQIPLSSYSNKYNYSYGINFGTSYISRYAISVSNLKNFDTTIALPLNYQFYYNKNTWRSKMDILPRWGQNFSFTYRHIPFDTEAKGKAWSLRTMFYLPGLLLNHGLQIRASIQENTGRYLYYQDIPMIDAYAFTNVEKVNNTILANYHFPISYPDWSIGQFSYIKRVRGLMSIHYQNIDKAINLSPNAISIGASIDFNMFKYTLPNFSIDLKATYLSANTVNKTLAPTISLNYSY